MTITITPNVALPSMPSIRDPFIRVQQVPSVVVTPERFLPYGRLVHDFAAERVFIETWPAQGFRRVEPGTGNQGGVAEGEFVMYREGDLMIAHNHAVDGHYVTGWFADPASAIAAGTTPNYDRILVSEANYHPDGGQVFFPKNGESFVALLALPGDDVTPEDFVAFQCDGSFGIQIRPNVWHQPVFPTGPRATFHDKQGRVHACVAVDFVREQGVYLSVPLGAGCQRKK